MIVNLTRTRRKNLTANLRSPKVLLLLLVIPMSTSNLTTTSVEQKVPMSGSDTATAVQKTYHIRLSSTTGLAKASAGSAGPITKPFCFPVSSLQLSLVRVCNLN